MIRAKFKCPKCNRDISVKAQSREGLMSQIFKCPYCLNEVPFSRILSDEQPAQGGTSSPTSTAAPGHVGTPAMQSGALKTHIVNSPFGAPAGGPAFQKTRMVSTAPLAIVVESTGRRIPVNVGSYVLGRDSSDSGASIKIAPDPYMSRLHARLDVQRAGKGIICKIQPLRSSNAVLVNSAPVEEGSSKALKPNDRVLLGMTTFRLELNR